MQTSFSNRGIYGGDSLSTGYDSTMNQEPAWQSGFGKSTNGPIPSWEPIIMSSAGRTLAAECAGVATYSRLFEATKTINAVLVAGPTNDIAITTYASLADAQTSISNLYNNTLLPCVSSLKAAGFQVVVVPTIPSRDSWNTTSDWKETARKAYNGLVASGAVANGYIVSDRAGAPFGVFNSSAGTSDRTYYFPGGTHLSNLGYAVFGATDRAAICSASPVCN
jgi:lysophospholipase L1-like esterase